MNKGKSVFVTVLIAAMLVLIDIGLYIISETGFAALTGSLAVYGHFRGAGDFRRWLTKEDSSSTVTKSTAMKPAAIMPATMKPVGTPQGHKTADRQKDEVLDRKKTSPQVAGY